MSLDRTLGPEWRDLGEYGCLHVGKNPDLVAVDCECHVVILMGRSGREGAERRLVSSLCRPACQAHAGKHHAKAAGGVCA